MRLQAKIFANWLGASKELSAQYIELAGITADELNQMRMGLMDRPDRKETAKRLAANGMSTRDIAEVTGWSFNTIARDLRVSDDTESVSNDTARSTTTGSAETKERRAAIAEAAAKDGVTEDPAEKYRIIYADPPWAYSNTKPDSSTEQRDHYAVMELEAICALPVKEWAEDNAVLFLWATSPILAESFAVVRAWGFTYKASFVWDKIKHNVGHYNSVRHELLLICTRGSCQPDCQILIDSVQSIERGAHSEKPVEFYDIIETLYVHGRRLELFARKRREGWDAHGHVAEIKAAE